MRDDNNSNNVNAASKPATSINGSASKTGDTSKTPPHNNSMAAASSTEVKEAVNDDIMPFYDDDVEMEECDQEEPVEGAAVMVSSVTPKIPLHMQPQQAQHQNTEEHRVEANVLDTRKDVQSPQRLQEKSPPLSLSAPLPPPLPPPPKQQLQHGNSPSRRQHPPRSITIPNSPHRPTPPNGNNNSNITVVSDASDNSIMMGAHGALMPGGLPGSGTAGGAAGASAQQLPLLMMSHSSSGSPKAAKPNISWTNLSTRPVLVEALEPLQADTHYFRRAGCVVTLTHTAVAPLLPAHLLNNRDAHTIVSMTTNATGVPAGAAATAPNVGWSSSLEFCGGAGGTGGTDSVVHGGGSQDRGLADLSPHDLSMMPCHEVRRWLHEALEEGRLSSNGNNRNTAPSLVSVGAAELHSWLDDAFSDTADDIQEAVVRYDRRRREDDRYQRILGMDEFELWRPPPLYDESSSSAAAGQPSPPPPRLSQVPLAAVCKLRRLLLPLTVQVVHSEYPTMAACVHLMDVSLLDVWIRDLVRQEPKPFRGKQATRLTPCKALLQRILDRLLLLAIRLRGDAKVYNGSTPMQMEYHSIVSLIVQTLRRVGTSHNYQGEWIDLKSLQITDLKLPLEDIKRCRRSCTEAELQNRVKIAAERAQLQNEKVQSANSKSKRAKSAPRLYDGHILMTSREDGISLNDFLRKALFMNKVNETIPRPFVPFESRPRFAQLTLGQDTLEELKNILFTKDGCLNPAIARDVSRDRKHHYITFTNDGADLDDIDRRWQIPFLMHGSSSSPQDAKSDVRSNVKSRSLIEAVLFEAGVLNKSVELVHDLGLLVGGTQDQNLHHDISRRWTFWLPSVGAENDVEPVLGWEHARHAYNETMAHRYAPTSLLLGMGRSGVIYLGVQKDQIERVSGLRGRRCCRVKHGRPHEIFRIVRENRYLVVIECQGGCMFTGDFPHAGVRNVRKNSTSETLLRELNRRIGLVLAEGMSDHAAQSAAVLKMLCRFKGLDKLCRLHCSTELLDSKITIPQNTIGYTSCKDNKVRKNSNYPDATAQIAAPDAASKDTKCMAKQCIAKKQKVPGTIEGGLELQPSKGNTSASVVKKRDLPIVATKQEDCFSDSSRKPQNTVDESIGTVEKAQRSTESGMLKQVIAKKQDSDIIEKQCVVMESKLQLDDASEMVPLNRKWKEEPAYESSVDSDSESEWSE